MRRLRDRRGPGGTRYTMREKMFSVGDDFWIETEGGERAFKVNGKALRVRETLVLESRSGEELLTIQEKKLSVRDKMEVERSGKTVATVKKALVGIRDRYSIEVDGGVGEENVAAVHSAGASVVVAGNAVFGEPDPPGAYERIKAAARMGERAG